MSVIIENSSDDELPNSGGKGGICWGWRQERHKMRLQKLGGWWRGLAVARALSDVMGDTVLLFIINARTGGGRVTTVLAETKI